MLDVIGKIEESLNSIDDIEIKYIKDFQESPAKTIQPDNLKLHPQIIKYLKSEYPAGLFTHQHQALEYILNDKHTVITTSTSSGKSLIFMIPPVNNYIEGEGSTALFIYPQKSLANDQLIKLNEILEKVTGKQPHPLFVARYDGATPQDIRQSIRKYGRFILTNPDEIHYSMLQYHNKWGHFLKKLKYIIIDESHTYRGIFGSSVAYIFRRLRALCRKYGSNPVFISASATIYKPIEHLKKLTGLEFLEVGPEYDGSKQGRKRIWLVRSKTRNHYGLTRTIMKTLVKNDLSTLAFCPSRISAERLAIDFTDNDDSQICVYRAGLNSDEREQIEENMRIGEIKGVFSTSALELGIDMGILDVVVCVGLPNTMMSLWQRAGRVGRSGREGGIIFIAAETPYDTYFTEHPKELFDRDHEPLALNLNNRRLLCHHLACSIQEFGDENLVDFSVLGEHIAHAFELRKSGKLDYEVFYSDDPHMRTPIRNASDRNYRLIVKDKSGIENDIGEIDPWHMLREAYPKGIYLHGGRAFRVIDIFRSRREIRLRPDFSHNITIPILKKTVYQHLIRSVQKYPNITIKLANLEVTERLISIQEKNRKGEIIKTYQGSQGLSPHRLPTEGVVIELSNSLSEKVSNIISEHNAGRQGVIQAIERLIRGLFPVISGPCDTLDFDTFSSTTGKITWYIYDQVHDGIDLTPQAYSHIPELFQKALNRVSTCQCTEDTGCLRCIIDPDKTTDSKETVVSKKACIEILSILCDELENSKPQHQVYNVDILAERPIENLCPKCKENTPLGARFCPNCGAQLEG